MPSGETREYGSADGNGTADGDAGQTATTTSLVAGRVTLEPRRHSSFKISSVRPEDGRYHRKEAL